MRRRAIVEEVRQEAPQDQPLHQKHRPSKFEDVLGQDEVVKSLKSALKASTRPHSFLFTGPSGCGKTTLARILASQLSCSMNNVIETDAATNTGIDSMRALTEVLKYQGFGDTPNRMIILDECHALSKAAWQSLLKAVEEPPPHVFFAFCTTDAAKVPDTIKTRCLVYNLRTVRHDVIVKLLERVCEEEDIRLFGDVIDLVARAADGSPRRALTMLSMVRECESKREAAVILEQPLENAEVIDLCRLLVAGRGLTWQKVQQTLSSLAEPNPEAVRIVVVNYLNVCLMKAASEKEVVRLLDVLAQFSKPINPSDKMAPILLAIGNILYPA